MSPGVPAIKERHAELEAALLHQIQQALPPAEPCTADECLRRHPPEPVLIRQGTPLGAIVMALEDRAHGATQMLRRNLGMRATRISQRLEQRPRVSVGILAAFSKREKRRTRPVVQELTGPSRPTNDDAANATWPRYARSFQSYREFSADLQGHGLVEATDSY